MPKEVQKCYPFSVLYPAKAFRISFVLYDGSVVEESVAFIDVETAHAYAEAEKRLLQEGTQRAKIIGFEVYEVSIQTFH
jgi:DNA-binding LacI/PurR family transcriptional regulator